jgi:hypothetical protein
VLAAVREHTRAEFHDNAGGGLERVTMHAPRLKEIAHPENAKMAVILLREQIQNP